MYRKLVTLPNTSIKDQLLALLSKFAEISEMLVTLVVGYSVSSVTCDH
jgi:hypothetical protein